jgi:predicted permease
MRTLFQDIRFALRLFAKNPAMTVVAVLSLGLATGPNAALFSVVNTLFLRGIPAAKPEELVAIRAVQNNRNESVTYPDYRDLAEEGSRAFSAVVAWERRPAHIGVRGWEEVCPANTVSSNYFQGLGIKPALGRLISPDLDSDTGSGIPVVISHSLWQRRFGGGRDVLDQTVLMDNRNLVIVGVAPPRFRGLDFQMPIDVWLPLSAMIRPRHLVSREEGPFEIVLGRLRPGATLEQARVELDGSAKRLAAVYPATNKDRTFAAWMYAKDRMNAGLVMGGVVLGLVSLVLLVACANVAGLLLAAAEARRKEIAVRLSLGAQRSRLVRQLLTESVVLGLMGGGAGLLLGYWLMKLPLQPPYGISLDFGVEMDWRVFVYAVVLSALTAVLFGLAPALRASRRDLISELKIQRGDAGSRRSFSLRNALVVGQIAVSQFLLAGTVLWVRSYLNVQSVRPGFDQERNVIFAQLSPTTTASEKPAGPGAFQAMIDRLRGLPGVLEVSGSAAIPLSGAGDGIRQKVLLPKDTEETPVRNNFVAPNYFAVMGTRLLQGRDFGARDVAAGKAVIVNQTLANRLADGGAAIGRSIRVGGVDREVIGVVEDGKYSYLRENVIPYMFLPSPSPPILAFATAGDPTAASEAVRRMVTEVVPQLRVVSFKTMKQNMRFATYLDRTAVALLGVLGLLGAFLAAVGLYGVIAQSVARRTREIGIRMALGAEPRKVLAMVLKEGFRMVIVGVTLGLAAAVAGAVAVSSLLFGVKPADPLSYACSAAVVVAIAILASHVPARRASRVDPAVALGSE